MRSILKNPYAYAIFIIPTIAMYFLFTIYPMASSAYLGFTDWDGLNDPKFIGFDNFVTAIKDPYFRDSIINNMYFILFSVFIQVPFIIFFAILIGGVKRFQRFYKTTVFVPSILSTAVIGILWQFIYHPEVGILNRFLGWFGIEPIYWLADTKWALLAILLTNAWQWMGFYIVLVLAAILAIPRELNEAAEIDGANGFQRAIRITVPLIKPIISVIVMLSIAGAMRVVDIILVMTKGGPVASTEVMASYMVNRAIKYGEYGYGTTLSIIIFVVALLLTAIYQLTFGRSKDEVNY
ncbi:sugar ABC transporter permease [Paenibacillus sp. GSMTC-2017]|uniref:carbohydrate ABC transporter permease n=1 Tax=Paenibacillus sp. GSMTC-2017 TaxID=2794350 RepID=UPI0018D66238|nr:sugar ABC transporter permease [Paenibacillus sp. GSMTC-2017]MBH5318869.1 sugar ABC transporter permease [Paenibacillus sp. GSMTC-2017]